MRNGVQPLVDGSLFALSTGVATQASDVEELVTMVILVAFELGGWNG